MTPTPAALASIDRVGIETAARLIAPHIRVTPIVTLDAADFGLPAGRLTLKLELFQHAGSFKTRGAFTHLLTRAIPPAGVVAASGGNHGVAVAEAARRLGLRARIFVPRVSSQAKIDRIRASQAELVVEGDRYAEALAASQAWAAESGALPVHAFDAIETLLGQGTLGLELSTQAPDLDTVMIAVGGGGLIGGVAAWYGGRARVVGVEPDGAPTLTNALAAGHPVDAPAGSIAADALAPQQVGALMFPLAQRYVDRVLLVTDEAIRHAQQTLWDRLRIVAEPAGAAALAALLSKAYVPAPDEHVGVVISGGNTTAVSFST